MNNTQLFDTEWHCLYNDLKYEYFKSPKNINNVLYWVKRIYKGRKCFAEENFDNKLFDVEIYDKNLNKTYMKVGSIECIEVRDVCYLREPNKKYIDTDFVIKDQFNETFETTIFGRKENNSLPNIVRLINKLKLINDTGSIESYFIYLDKKKGLNWTKR